MTGSDRTPTQDATPAPGATPTTSRASGSGGALTFGVEEEFHIVDPETGALSASARRLLGAADVDAEAELQRSMIETATGVHTTLADLRADIVAKRRTLADAAERYGLAVVGAGTVPPAGKGQVAIYPNARYAWIEGEYANLVAEQQVCACQVHVGVEDRDLAVRITRRIRAHLPTLLAISASSPYFQDEDTGYASYRSVVVSRWPTAGPPPAFVSAADLDRTVETMVASGVISDPGMIYFDARLSSRYPTIEIRIADGCPSVDDAVLLAALGRGLVATAAEADAAGAPLPDDHEVLLRAATWRAGRSGLEKMLVDPLTQRPASAVEVVESLVEYVRPALVATGDWEDVATLVKQVLTRGTSAHRQREAVAGGAGHAELIAALARETAQA